MHGNRLSMLGRAWLLFLATSSLADASSGEGSSNPPCRFAPAYKERDIVRNPSPFIEDVLFWDGNFVRPGIGYNHANGMSYDGTLLNQTTGMAPAHGSGRHNFSAASKESLHVMLLAQVLAGNKDAARVVSPGSQEMAQRKAYEIMDQKLRTYLAFNETFPGFGGLLPWYNNTYAHLNPTNDWVNRLPALDNGELLWAIYAAVQALSCSHDHQYRRLGSRWQAWLDYTKTTAAKLFYHGKGRVCAVITLNQTLSPHSPAQNYTCEGNDLLDDPYEGELFTWWLYFFSKDLSNSDRDALWIRKRAKLQPTTYQDANIGPITVQKGYWFSSHEQWKVLEMPYYDIPLVKELFTNAEIARTCNSAAQDGIYDEFAKRTGDEYARVFTDVKSGDEKLCLPTAKVPSAGLKDYTGCA